MLLALEPVAPGGREARVAQDLDGDSALGVEALGAEDRAHAALAEHSRDVIRPDVGRQRPRLGAEEPARRLGEPARQHGVAAGLGVEVQELQHFGRDRRGVGARRPQRLGRSAAAEIGRAEEQILNQPRASRSRSTLPSVLA